MTMNSPRQIRRRAKLSALVGTDIGAQAELAREVKTPKSHLSAILKGRRGVGDQLAAKLERHFRKPAGWFDEEESGLSPEVAQLAADIDALPSPAREHVLLVCRHTVEAAKGVNAAVQIAQNDDSRVNRKA